jgi:hypothetical protein
VGHPVWPGTRPDHQCFARVPPFAVSPRGRGTAVAPDRGGDIALNSPCPIAAEPAVS